MLSGSSSRWLWLGAALFGVWLVSDVPRWLATCDLADTGRRNSSLGVSSPRATPGVEADMARCRWGVSFQPYVDLPGGVVAWATGDAVSLLLGFSGYRAGGIGGSCERWGFIAGAGGYGEKADRDLAVGRYAASGLATGHNADPVIGGGRSIADR